MGKIFLDNPPHKAKRKRASGRPSPAQLRARKKFAEAARARSRKAKSTRAAKGASPVAKRKRKRSGVRRRSAARVLHANPKRRRRRHVVRSAARHHRRRHYARNPNLMSEVKSFALETGVGIAGMAGAGFASKKLSEMAGLSDPLARNGMTIAIGLGIRLFGPRLGISREYARIAGNAAALIPSRDVIVSVAPETAAYLSSYSLGANVTAIPDFRRRLLAPRRSDATPLESYSLSSYTNGNSQPG